MAPSATLLKTAKDYFNALSTLNTDALTALTTESFYITMAPNSTGLTREDGVSVLREGLLQRFQGMKAVTSCLNVKIQREWPANEASNQVTMLTTGDVDFHPHIVGDDSKDEWVFRPEVLYIFTMDESGEKVTHLFEFQDSVALKTMGPVFAKAMEKAAKSG